MSVELFSVMDQVAERYMDPFAGPTVAFAIRGFEEACRDPQHQFAKFPEDYALYHIGSFDPELGVISALPARKVAVASNFVTNHGDQLNLMEEA